jgi:hypothetical protein
MLENDLMGVFDCFFAREGPILKSSYGLFDIFVHVSDNA